MKTRISSLLLAVLGGCVLVELVADVPSITRAEKVEMSSSGAAHQLVFFAVLEGLYRDGVRQDDVEAILARKSKDACYDHFIYACPICTATVQALELYRDRPPLYSLKPVGNAADRTFGDGLDDPTRTQLRDPDARVRLKAIHRLLSRWISARLDSIALSKAQKEKLLAELKAGRDKGMEFLKRWQEKPEDLARYAPAFAEIGECAACNAALQMTFTPP